MSVQWSSGDEVNHTLRNWTDSNTAKTLRGEQSWDGNRLKVVREH